MSTQKTITPQHPNQAILEAARVAAMDLATLATQVKGTVTGVQQATDGSANWMLSEARKNVQDAQHRLEALERLLGSLA